jgi:hypothetical protein
VTFTVTVSECVQPGLGQQILLVGNSGRVPIYLISSVPLTNLQMTLISPPGRLVSFSIQPIVPQICATSITPLTNSLQQFNLMACASQWLIGTQQVAWLNFTAATNQSSAFAGLSFTNLAGYMPDGTPVANFAPQSGRAVVVGEEPLLECVRGSNGQPSLVLYGKPASGYAIQTSTNFVAGQWATALTNLTVGTNLFLQVATPTSSSPVNFYRALRVALVNQTPSLQMTRGINGQFVLVLRGQPGNDYAVDRCGSLSPSPQWSLWQQVSLTNQSISITVPPSGPQQFYRARLQ